MTETNLATANGAASKGSAGVDGAPSTNVDTAAYRELGETVQPIARSIDKLLKEAEPLEDGDATLADLGLELKSALVAYESHIVKRRRVKQDRRSV